MKTIKFFLVIAFMAMTTSVFAQQKFGVVNAQEVMMKMPEIDSVQIKLDKVKTDLTDQMQATEKEYNTKLQDYTKNKDSYSAVMREQKEKEIMSIQQRMEEFQGVAQRELQEQQQILMTPIQKRLMDAITKIGKDNGYVFIFDKSSALYSSETLVTDVTALVKAELKLK